LVRVALKESHVIVSRRPWQDLNGNIASTWWRHRMSDIVDYLVLVSADGVAWMKGL